MATSMQQANGPKGRLKQLGRAQVKWACLVGLAAFAGIAPGAVATRVSSEQAALARLAAKSSASAQQNLRAGNAQRAIASAERAVAAMPRSAAYRVQLGQAYMAAGRFSSAGAAFQDALSLDPDNGTAILRLALVRVAEGNSKAALDLLQSQQSNLSISDYGLALALAGDPASGINVLVSAVRAGEANAKLRQNLALAFALAGRWDDARATAQLDLPPESVDTRLKQWAALARPSQPWAQVAELMRIKVPANWQQDDPGQPQELALEVPDTATKALAKVESSAPPLPKWAEPMEPPTLLSAAQSDTEASRYEVSADRTNPVQTPARVQDERNPETVPALRKNWVSALADRTEYVVQIGAYSSPQAAARSWAQAAKRWRYLQAYDVHKARIQAAKGVVYRVSLGKFSSRDEARRVCAQLRVQGGSCFPRAITGFDNVQWAARSANRPRLLALR